MNKIFLAAATEREFSPFKKTPIDNAVLFPCGIGMINAAVNLSDYFAKNNIVTFSHAIFLGTSGIAAGKDRPLEFVYIVTKIKLLLCNAKDYFPLPMQTEVNSTINKAMFVQNGAKSAKCRSSLAISANNYQENGETLIENLEIFSFAEVCRRYQIPWCGLSVATNYTNSNAHKDWKKNNARASEITCKFLSKIL